MKYFLQVFRECVAGAILFGANVAIGGATFSATASLKGVENDGRLEVMLRGEALWGFSIYEAKEIKKWTFREYFTATNHARHTLSFPLVSGTNFFLIKESLDLPVDRPFFVSQPKAPYQLFEGESFSLHSQAISGDGRPVFYQWLKNGIELSNRTDASFVQNVSSNNHSGEYVVKASLDNKKWVYSDPANVLVSVKPAITKQPETVLTNEGADIQFSVEIKGDFKRIEWYHDDRLVGGATNLVLHLQRITAADVGVYQAHVWFSTLSSRFDTVAAVAGIAPAAGSLIGPELLSGKTFDLDVSKSWRGRPLTSNFLQFCAQDIPASVLVQEGCYRAGNLNGDFTTQENVWAGWEPSGNYKWRRDDGWSGSIEILSEVTGRSLTGKLWFVRENLGVIELNSTDVYPRGLWLYGLFQIR